MISSPPPPAMTPLPPLNPSSGENVWPITANADAITWPQVGVSHGAPPTIQPATRTAAVPLSRSPAKTTIAQRQPNVRRTLVAPVLPLPIRVRSTPCRHPTIAPVGIIPKR